jgi:rRNA maturation protein Nop10
MTEVIDKQGRWILTSEPCRFCGADSKLMHPAGVVSGRWTCTRCGGKQADALPGKTDSIYAADMHHEATS